MASRVSRLGIVILAALFVGTGIGAGELFRPVPPDAQVTRFTRFNIRYTLRDVVADGVQKVEFYITDDMGKTWRLYGEDPDRTSPMTIQVPGEGVYGFVCVATDRFGNREREPGPRTRPETVVVVDRTPPQAKWLGPLKDILSQQPEVEFAWETSDPYLGPAPVRIKYAHNAASNHEPNADWQILQEKLPAAGSSRLLVPGEASGRYNFRLVVEDRAGNYTVAYNPATLTIDRDPPRIVSVSPLKSNKLDVDVMVEADDGPNGSGVKTISLYTSSNNGVVWDLTKETTPEGESVPVRRAPGQPIPFKAPQSGEYPLWPVVFDMADNASPMPPRGIPGPYVLVIDTEPPSVTLSNSFLEGRNAVLANETRVVEWTSYDPHPREGTGKVFLSLNNGSNWQEIRSGLSSTGSAVINFPFGSASEEAMLKVTVEDDFGNVGESLSQVFKLSAADTVITDVAPVGSQPDYGSYTPPSPVQTGDPYSQPDSYTQPYQQPAYDQPYVPAPSTSTSAYAPPASYGSGIDNYGAPSQPYAPPTVGDSYSGGLYGSTSSSSVPGQSESTAGSFPSAMLSGQPLSTPTAPAASSPAAAQPPTFVPSPPLADSGAVQPPAAWAPTPPAAAAQTPDLGSAFVSSPVSAPPSLTIPGQQESAPGILPPPVSVPAAPAETATAPSLTIPAPPPASSAGSSTTALVLPPPAGSADAAAPDPFSDLGSGQGTTNLAPPPVMGGTSGSAASSSTSTFSFDDFSAGSLTPPPLPSEAASGLPTPTATPTASAAPAVPVVPAAPAAAQEKASQSLPLPALTAPSASPATPAAPATLPAAAPAAPASTGFETGPQEVAALPNFDSAGLDDTLAPPPMAPAGTLPTDPRQLSNYYADEAKNYIDEGRMDLALDSATRSLNADNQNALAYARLAQVYVQQDPPNFPRAATLAKEATALGRDWYSWWACADVFYRWSHARNRAVQTQLRSGQRPAPDLLDERNQALNNAQIAIGNAARLVQQGGSETDREQVVMTQGEITYLRALSIPEPLRPAPNAPAAAQDEYRRSLATYKASVTPIFQEALPYFETAMQLGGSPSYRETFHMGIINFRLGGLEKDTGNSQQAARYYENAARYLEEATISTQVPAEGPREAYYMLAYCHDQLAEQPGRDRSRQKEMALRYWRRTAEFYAPGSSYRDYAEQRIIALQHELGL